MKKYSLKERIKYRFDNMMSRGNAGIVKLLIVVTVVCVLLLTLGVHLATPAEDRDFGGSLWDVLATTINAWMPYSEDGNLGYIILTGIAAVIGLLFASMLIGIISSAFEEKITTLKEGHSRVLESGHTVVIGFELGKVALLNQLIAAAGDKKSCILIASELTKTEMEDNIREEVEVPKNVRIICRNIEPDNPTSLNVLSLPECGVVIINEENDVDAVKMILSACRILAENGRDTKIISTVASKDMMIPSSIAKEMNVICVQTNDMIARIIAHSCTEPGLSSAYNALFDVAGPVNIYIDPQPETTGRRFGELATAARGGIVLGAKTKDGVLLNPPADLLLEADDELILCKSPDSELSFADIAAPAPVSYEIKSNNENDRTLVLGNSVSLQTMLAEFPEESGKVTLAEGAEKYSNLVRETVAKRPDLFIDYLSKDLDEMENLEEVLRRVDHVILLADDAVSADNSDTLNILRYYKIKRILRKYDLNVSVTLEFKSENNLRLIQNENVDFIVTPHFVSMFLAQLSIEPDNVKVFKELLSNEGCEIHIKPADALKTAEALTVAELRAALTGAQMLFIGYLKDGEIRICQDAEEVLITKDVDELIVLSEK